jgi:hypothetical protein
VIHYQDFLYGISLPDNWIFNKAWYQGKIKMSAISKEKIKIRVLNKNSRHLDRMTRRSDKCDLYEYINRKNKVDGKIKL